MKPLRSFFVFLVLALPATKAGASDGEASIAELERAAIGTAHLGPEQVERWRRRMRLAALVPALRLRLSRGTTDLQTTTDYNGSTRLTVGDHNAWQFEVAASWNLERLVWHPDEMRIAREAQRIAARREKLVMEVAAMATERKRLLTGMRLDPPATVMDAAEARLRIDELTSVLDGLTGGALGLSREPPGDLAPAPASHTGSDDSGDGDPGP